MRNRFREEVYDHPPIVITCPYCGKPTHMPQPNIDDWDHLMDEDCTACGQHVFAQFEFVPKLTKVYRLTPVGPAIETPEGTPYDTI